MKKRSAKIIGKITLSEEQREELIKLGVHDIAEDNPKNHLDTNEIIKRIGDAEAIIVNISTPISKEVIQGCKNLRFIQTWSTGTDNIDIHAANAAEIIVKNVPDYSSESVAEKTIAMMIFISNKMREAHQDVLAGNWNYTNFPGIELKGRVLGLIGIGKIGTRVTELAKAFGMIVLSANSKTKKDDLKKICAQSDFISIHCPLTPSTKHLISENEFNAMKKGVYLVNNSRGGVLDEDALLNALNKGIVSYAAIDVLEKEPPDESNPLINHPKVYITPHTAWNTKDSIYRLTAECIENLKQYLRIPESVLPINA